MDLKRAVKQNREFVALLGLFTALQLVLLLKIWRKPLIWDTAIYLAMGKYLFTGGKIGLWEVFRPPLLPAVAGTFWKLGMPPVGFTRLLAVMFSVTGAAGIYYMVRDIYTERQALLTLALLLSTGLYFWHSNMLLTGLPASILVFTSLYFVEKERYLLGGFFGGIAFLLRFPSAMVGPAAVIYIAYRYRHEIKLLVKNAMLYTVAFFATAAPYLYAMKHFYGSYLQPFISGVMVPASTADSYMAGIYYVFHVIKSNPLMVFFPLGIYLALKPRERGRYVFLSGLVLFYGFFTVFPHKEPRFALLFLPLLALFGARGLERVMEEFDSRYGFRGYDTLTVVLAAAAIVMTGAFGGAWTQKSVNTDAVQYYRAHSNVTGVVAANDASIMAYGDIKYFALPPATLEGSFERAKTRVDYFSINSCAWYCTPSIENCEQKIERVENTLESNYTNVFEHNGSYCNYDIYRNR
ncbi:MAG: ArnT family glycosyltransferase [Candidatus Nanohaloarchaea archaeon]